MADPERETPPLAFQAVVLLAFKALERLIDRPELHRDPNLRMRCQDVYHGLKRHVKSSGVFKFDPEVTD